MQTTAQISVFRLVALRCTLTHIQVTVYYFVLKVYMLKIQTGSASQDAALHNLPTI